MDQTAFYCAMSLCCYRSQCRLVTPVISWECWVIPRRMSCKLKHSPSRPVWVQPWASNAHTPAHCAGLCHALAPLETRCCFSTLPSKVWKWGDTGTSSGAEYLEHHIIGSTNHFHLGGGKGAVRFVNSVLWLIYSNINMPGEVDQNILWIYKYSYTNICHICIVITLFSWEEKRLFEEGPK